MWRTSFALLLLIAIIVSGCSSDEASATSAPHTVALIPPTDTPTSTPIPPTVTPQTLTEPEQLVPTSGTTPTINLDFASLVDIDPVANELVGVAQRALAQQLNLPTRRIRISDVQAVVWSDTSLGCPSPNTVYTQIATNGYRIVLTVAGQDYIYHTDFDRVFPCSLDNEQLLSGLTSLLEATPETTPAQ